MLSVQSVGEKKRLRENKEVKFVGENYIEPTLKIKKYNPKKNTCQSQYFFVTLQSFLRI